MAGAGFVRSITAAMRLPTLPLALLPVAIAASVTDPVDAGRLGLCVVVVASLHVAGILVTDLFDHRAGTDKLARLDRSAVPTGSLQLESGTLTPRQVRLVALIAIAIAVAGTAALRRTELWWLLGAGLVLITQQAGPPLRLAYVGSGLGELALLAAYGPLPAAATVHALDGVADAEVLVASTIVGALTVMGFASHHLLHWRSDRAATKRTPAVVFGEEGALAFIGLVDIATYLTLIVVAILGIVPVLAVAGVIGAPIVGVTWQRALADPLPQRSMALIGAHLAAAVLATIAIVVAVRV